MPSSLVNQQVTASSAGALGVPPSSVLSKKPILVSNAGSDGARASSFSGASADDRGGDEIKRLRSMESICDEFLRLLQGDHVEYGRTSSAEVFCVEWLKKDRFLAQAALSNLYINNIERPNVLVAILQVIAHVGRPMITPSGDSLAMAAMTHQSLEVRESGLRVFEYWEDPTALPILYNTRLSPRWLDQYRMDVISQLEA